jgi:hypothetical protein
MKIPANGTPTEIFIHYGDNFDSVMLREVNTRLSRDDLESKRERLADADVECIHAIRKFDYSDVDVCVEYFFSVFACSGADEFDPLLLKRALLSMVILLNRVKNDLWVMRNTESNKTTDSGTNRFRELYSSSRRLVRLISNKLKQRTNDEELRILLEDPKSHDGYDVMENGILEILHLGRLSKPLHDV